MKDDIYLEAFTSARREYGSLLDRYEELTKEVASVEARMRQLKDTIASLGRLCEQIDDGDNPKNLPTELAHVTGLGLTDAVREVFRSRPEEFLFPSEVADLLIQAGYDRGTMMTSNIYTVCKRMRKAGQLDRKDIEGKAAYKFAIFKYVEQRKQASQEGQKPVSHD